MFYVRHTNGNMKKETFKNEADAQAFCDSVNAKFKKARWYVIHSSSLHPNAFI